MNKGKRLWTVPAACFALCCALDIFGCMTHGGIGRMVKPALMPLLSVATLAWLAERGIASRRSAAMLLCAQLFGFGGDTLLLGRGDACFAGGLVLFLIGHLFYICLFGRKSLKGLKPAHIAAGIASGIIVTALLVLAIGIKGTMLVPMSIYGFTLMMLVFCTFSGALRFGASWWMPFCGAVLFCFSDSLIAIGRFGELSRFMKDFMLMFTYLLAQTLLALGGAGLAAPGGDFAESEQEGIS